MILLLKTAMIIIRRDFKAKKIINMETHQILNHYSISQNSSFLIKNSNHNLIQGILKKKEKMAIIKDSAAILIKAEFLKFKNGFTL